MNGSVVERVEGRAGRAQHRGIVVDLREVDQRVTVILPRLSMLMVSVCHSLRQWAGLSITTTACADANVIILCSYNRHMMYGKT